MIGFHGEKCRHCGANMTEPKPITDGPRKGGMRTICTRCGHIEYQTAAKAASMPQQQNAQPQHEMLAPGLVLRKPATPPPASGKPKVLF